MADLAQQFTQGDVTTTGNSLDIAISGGGFYRMVDNGSVTYTRNGQFKLDRSGYIVNAQGMQLTGVPADATGAINAGSPQPLQLETADVPPQASTTATVSVGLAATATVPTVPFDIAAASSYAGGTSMPVFDSLGREHSLGLYFRKVADNAWEVHGSADGAALGAALGTLNFNTDGSLNAATSTIPMTVAVPVGADAGGTQAIEISMAGVTQFGSEFSISELEQDGYASGRLAGFSVGADGTILSRYTNGVTVARGRVALANFANPQGLQPLGDNQWAETADSGAAMIGAPGSGTLGSLQSGAVESSNVDLTAELVNMIMAQRVYQANAQTIKTNDQLLQTVVNLR